MPKHDEKLERARALLDGGEPTLDELAAAVGLSASYLQRSFTARYGLSPAHYLAQKKLDALKSGLRAGSEVSAALYDAGYGSPSRVYEQGAIKLGMTPATYRAGGAGMQIRWSLVETVLGNALVAATERGICAIELGEDAALLERNLQHEFPNAELQRVEAGSDEFLAPRLHAVAQRLAGHAAELPLDLVGTAFQRRVWEALMKFRTGRPAAMPNWPLRGRPRARRARWRVPALPTALRWWCLATASSVAMVHWAGIAGACR